MDAEQISALEEVRIKVKSMVLLCDDTFKGRKAQRMGEQCLNILDNLLPEPSDDSKVLPKYRPSDLFQERQQNV